jgi:hypothetical protein
MAFQRLPKLSDNLRVGDLGASFKYLTSIFPNWSNELHRLGNFLQKDKLQTIFNEGLLDWYIKKFCVPMHIHTPLDLNKITFYDFKGYMAIAKKFGINVSTELERLDMYESYQRYFSDNMLNVTNTECRYTISECNQYMTFASLVRKRYMHLIEGLVNDTTQHVQFIQQYFGGDVITGLKNIIIASTEIPQLGLIFQRYKIVLEKMNKFSMNNCNDEYMRTMYRVDKMLDLLQEMMVHRIRHIVEAMENVLITGDLTELEIRLCDRSMYVGEYEFIFIEMTNDDSILFNNITDGDIENGVGVVHLLRDVLSNVTLVVN